MEEQALLFLLLDILKVIQAKENPHLTNHSHYGFQMMEILHIGGIALILAAHLVTAI